MHPQWFWWQQHFFRGPTVSKRLCVVSLAPKQLWYSALQVGCQTLASSCRIIHSVYNNPRSLYLNMKVFIFAKDENMRFFKPLLTWVMNKNVHTSVTTPNFILTCSSRALYNYYNFQVADYWYSTATLSYKSLWYLMCTLSCRLAFGFIRNIK